MGWIIIDALIVGGLVAQGAGLYAQVGPGWTAVIVGSETLVIGLAGAVRAVR